MKTNKLIIIIALTILISLVGFIYITDKKSKEIEMQKAIEKEQKAEEDKKINSELDKLEITPTIEKDELTNSSSSSGSDLPSEESPDESALDLIKKERVEILTYTNIKECDTLTYLVKECKNNFLYSLAVESNNVDYCNRLSSKTEIANCRDEVNYNNERCSLIKNTFLKQKCEYNSSLLKQEKTEERIIVSSKTSKDTSICSSLSSYQEKESCLKNIILNTKDINLCFSFFTTSEEKNKCYKNISYEFNRALIAEAFEKKDISICEKLTVIELKNQCKTMKF